MSEDSSKEPTIEQQKAAKLAEATAKNPGRRLFVADTPAGIMVVGNPEQANYLLYRQFIQGDDATDKARSADVLLQFCAVDPPPEAIPGILKDYPALAGSLEISIAVGKACGLTKADIAKK